LIGRQRVRFHNLSAVPLFFLSWLILITDKSVDARISTDKLADQLISAEVSRSQLVIQLIQGVLRELADESKEGE
jgi:hypothetical protein